MLRREIITGLGAATTLALLSSAGRANACAGTNRDVLVTIFLRGGADGLNLLVPHGDDDYYNRRGAVGIPKPDAANGAIDLNGYFGLHPAFENLYKQAASDLAFLPNVGDMAGSRSHFEAMDRIEYATGNKTPELGGWLGRYLMHAAPSVETPVIRAVAINGSVQKSLSEGENSGTGFPTAIIASEDSEDFSLDYEDEGQFKTTLKSLYHRNEDLDVQACNLIEVLDDLETEQPWTREPQNGAVYPTGGQGLGDRLRTAAEFIDAFPELEVITIDMGGWDTHSNARNRMNSLVSELADSLKAFYQDLGTDMQNITVLVMTEFGRRVGSNASGGTDHGSGSCLLALGGGVNGGLHADHWTQKTGGLAELTDDRGDVSAIFDHRDVMAQLLEYRTGYCGDWDAIFPNYSNPGLGFDLFKKRL